MTERCKTNYGKPHAKPSLIADGLIWWRKCLAWPTLFSRCGEM